ncbi:MAG: PIN domain-containing protein [Planctomycetota bacterium]
MSSLVETSVWSMALRRGDATPSEPVVRLKSALANGEPVFTTGIILQELLQGFTRKRSRDQILESFAAFAFIVPDRLDHIEAADIHTRCRRKGVQIGTIDALLAQIAIRHDLSLLTLDRDFEHMQKIVPLRLLDR